MKPTQVASNGTSTREANVLLKTLIAFKNGTFSVRMPVDETGVAGKIADTLNDILELNQKMAREYERISRAVGKEGKITQRASLGSARGAWADCVESVNSLIGDLVQPSTEVARVIGAVAKGDLSQTMSLEVDGRPLRGEFLHTARVVNTMVEQLNSFASEVTRVAREVGTDGKLGGQAQVKGVAGTWKDLTDSVNLMASNLTGQVRGIAKVVTSVAKGNLRQKLSIDAKGEVAQLTDTINEMIDTLAIFSDQVTTVAREVGAEGKLGGQANVPGASGTWKNLTENGNQLAQNLTTQVRSISEVASAVTKGDLTRTIRVEAKGEVEALKDTINQMIANLKETTLRNQEQDWLKSNLAKFTQMLQGQKDLNTVTKRILSELAQVVNAQHGLFYIMEAKEDILESKLKLIAAYAFRRRKELANEFAMGEGLVGQCALEKERILLTNVPGDYVRISSRLGEHAALHTTVPTTPVV